MCFAFGDASCYLYEERWDPTREDPTYWWRLSSAVWISSFIALVRVSGFSTALRARRASRLRKRVFGHSEAALLAQSPTKLMHGLKGVMNLVHDPSLKVSLSFESLSYHLETARTCSRTHQARSRVTK